MSDRTVFSPVFWASQTQRHCYATESRSQVLGDRQDFEGEDFTIITGNQQLLR